MPKGVAPPPRPDPLAEFLREGAPTPGGATTTVRPITTPKLLRKPSGPARGWSVAIAFFADPELARMGLEKVRTVGGFPEAFLESEGATHTILYGSFESPGASDAKRALERVREREVDGAKPFAGAVMSAPPKRVEYGGHPEYSLDSVRDEHGEKAELYTLLIGQYERPDHSTPTPKELAEFRAAAEAAVLALRREGKEAFYHHGPGFSTVSVGVFTPADYNPNAPRSLDSPGLAAARSGHPTLLQNGREARQRIPGSDRTRAMPSLVVLVPP